MLRKSKKSLAILLTLAMLATLFVGVPTASAVSTYSANFVQNVSAGNWYADALATDIFNRVIVEVSAGSLPAPPATTTFRVSLPIDYTATILPATIANGRIPTFSSGTNQVATVTVTPVGAAVTSPTLANATYREYDVTVTAAASADRGLFYLDFQSFNVPSGKSGEIKLTIDAPPGTPMSSGSVLIAQIGSGSVTLALDDIKTITTAGGAIGDLLIKEDRAGALATTGNAVKVKLPNGFTWNTPTFPGVTGAAIWSTSDAAVIPNTAATDLTTADSGRTLVINNPKGAASSDASYYRISGLSIAVDESIAKIGDIVATISGDSSINTSSVTVGTLGDYSVTVSAFGDPKEVKAGKADQEIGKIAIEESVANSLTGGRTITLQLTGGAKWNVFPNIDNSNSKNTNALAWSAVGTTGDTIKATVTASANAAKYVLEKGSIDVSGQANEDIKVIVAGTAGASGEVLVAKTVKPVSITASKIAEVVVGQGGQLIGDVLITENSAEAIPSTNAAGAYTPFTTAGGPAGGLFLHFPAGVTPSLPTSVEVVEGDIVLDPTSVAAGVTNDGRWAIGVTVRSTSSTPSTVKFSGIKLTVDRSVAEGAINASVKGNVVQTAGLFPAATSVGSVQVAQVVTPAPGEQKANVAFVIGQTTYTANGVEQTMDVAPYIKDSRTYMPLRYVAMALGVSEHNIMWDAVAQTATLIKGDKVVQVKIGSTVMLVNGVSINMDVAPEITSDRTMLPLRWIGQAFGADFTWDDATQTATMNL
jgi:hypothetical protein